MGCDAAAPWKAGDARGEKARNSFLFWHLLGGINHWMFSALEKGS